MYTTQLNYILLSLIFF